MIVFSFLIFGFYFTVLLLIIIFSNSAFSLGPGFMCTCCVYMPVCLLS